MDLKVGYKWDYTRGIEATKSFGYSEIVGIENGKYYVSDDGEKSAEIYDTKEELEKRILS